MARKLGEAFVEIKANLDKLKSGLDQARALTQRAVGDMVENFGLIEVALQKVRNAGIALTLGVTVPIVIASRSFIALGSAANELENRFNITFGNMAGDVNEWSAELSAAFGRSRFDIRSYVATFNSMLKPVGLGAEATRAMSKELASLVFDFGSFRDLEPEVAFLKLQSGLAGMSIPLKRFIGDISETTTKAFALKMGIIEVGEQMNEAQKIVARFGLIMEGMKDAIGDAIRTGKDWANQWQRMLGTIKDISVAIGQSMIPFFGIFLRILNDTILPIALITAEWFAMRPVLSGIITAMVVLVAAIGPLLLATVALVGLWIKWRIGSALLRGALFAMRIEIKGVTIANWLMNRSFVFTKAVVAAMQGAFLRLRLMLMSVAAHFKIASISSISFASIWTGAAGIIAAGAALVTTAFRLMWAAILGPAGLAIIAITGLVFVLEHLLAKRAMKGIKEETDALNKALKSLSGGAGGAGGAGDTGGAGGLGRTVSGPVLGLLAGGGEGFSRIFAGTAGAIGIKPKGDQLVAGKLDRTNELLAEIAGNGMSPALVLA